MKLPAGPKTPNWLLNQQFQADPNGYMDAICQRYGDTITIISGSTPTVHALTLPTSPRVSRKSRKTPG